VFFFTCFSHPSNEFNDYLSSTSINLITQIYEVIYHSSTGLIKTNIHKNYQCKCMQLMLMWVDHHKFEFHSKQKNKNNEIAFNVKLQLNLCKTFSPLGVIIVIIVDYLSLFIYWTGNIWLCLSNAHFNILFSFPSFRPFYDSLHFTLEK
jgi:hypothetical protein